MFRNREEMRQRLQAIIEIFRQKGATSTEKAMTIQELGLPPRFQEAMHRRLGQSGIFVEVNGKYYLSEDRLKQIQEQHQRAGSGDNESGGWSKRGQSGWFRVAGFLLMLPIGIIIAVALFYLFGYGGGFFPGEFLVILLLIFVGLSIARMLFWRSRRRYWRTNLSYVNSASWIFFNVR